MAVDRHDVRLTWDVRIPLRDGVELSATLYLPEGQEAPKPALFTLTPYVAQVSHELGVYFAERGYPFLTVDVRGRGNADGRFRANGNEARDGHDIVEWLAAQPFCNGKVGMWGGSYAGYVQWAAARELPPHLASIAPVASPYRGVDSPAPKNVFLPYRLQWLTLLAGRTSQDRIFGDQRFWNRQYLRFFRSGRPFRELDSFVGLPSPIFQEWLQHPEPDAYWDGYNPAPEQYARIDLPILTITGIYDANQLGALAHYRAHLKHATPEARARHILVLGPWDHAGTRTPAPRFGGIELGAAALIDMPGLHLEWYRWTLEDGPRPSFLKRNVAYYLMGAETWRYADSLEAVTGREQPLYLGASANPDDVFSAGGLGPAPGAETPPSSYVYDPKDLSLAELESEVEPTSLVDQRVLLASAGKRLVFQSAPFETDTDVAGFFRLEAWLAIDCPDTDFRVTVHEIDEGGRSVLLTSDVVRARYREGLRSPTLISTAEPLPYVFDGFTFVARRIARGRRLRLVFGPTNSIHFQRNHNTGGVVAEETLEDARPVTVRLFHDRERPSALVMPLAAEER